MVWSQNYLSNAIESYIPEICPSPFHGIRGPFLSVEDEVPWPMVDSKYFQRRIRVKQKLLMMKDLRRVHHKNDAIGKGIWLLLWSRRFKMLTRVMTGDIIPEHVMVSEGIDKFYTISEIFIHTNILSI